MSRKVIDTHGMSPNDSLYGEKIRLSDGRVMEAILEVYPVLDSDPNTVFAVMIDGATARYDAAEVETIGFGNFNQGAAMIMNAARVYEPFEQGQPRPIEPIEL